MDFIYISLLAVTLVAICVTIHYETLRRLSSIAHQPGSHRWLVLVSVYGALLAHIVEIWVFAGGYWLAEQLGLGNIDTIKDPFDYIYYSSMVYTTVGFGDLIPSAEMRMLTSAEALGGLALITWSASFTYLQMQRLWRD
jgi:hypothetical protein